MSINQLHIQEFMSFFSGSQHNYGEFSYTDEYENNKRVGKGSTITNTLITYQNYKDHLEGKKGLGIIPITENNKCFFSVIDVDIYDADLTFYIEAIDRYNFPLVPFKSKSNGLHIYIFFKEETDTKEVLPIMRMFAFLLSIDILVKTKKNETVEIFPKQVLLRKGDIGNWINLPYYNAKDAQTKSLIINRDTSLNLSSALVHIKNRRTTLLEAKEFINLLIYNDAPPCLQRLFLLNNLDLHNGRNDFLFCFGVYLKKKDENFFEQNLMDINNNLIASLSEKEVEKTIIRSLRKKDYTYKCKSSPCQDYCDKKECKKREYGIGKNDGYFSTIELGQLYQYKMAIPYYEWEVRLQGQENFLRLRFKTEDEIIRQDVFLRLCMRDLYELPTKLKLTEWFNRVNQALKDIKVINVDVDDDTSPMTLFYNYFMDFLTNKSLAETKEQILRGKVYYSKEEEVYLFRGKDLTNFLFIKKGFKHFSTGELHGILRDIGCIQKKVQVAIIDGSRKQPNVLMITKEKVEAHLYKEDYQVNFDSYKEDY